MSTMYSGNTNSKSLNARQAEREGRYPATGMAETLRAKGLFKGVVAADIKAAVHSGEWHHVGAYAARVDYYDLLDVYACRRALRAAIAARKAAPKAAGERREGCTVTWLEWSGTRAHPRAKEYTAVGVAVTVKGSFATIHMEMGGACFRSDKTPPRPVGVLRSHDIRKNLSARGFRLQAE